MEHTAQALCLYMYMTVFLAAHNRECRAICFGHDDVSSCVTTEQGMYATIGLVITMFLAEQGICRAIGLVMTVFLAA